MTILDEVGTRGGTAEAAPAPCRRRRRVNLGVYVALLPVVLVLAVFAYYPALNGIWHSFYEWRPGFTSTFTGLENYRTMLGDELWWRSFRNIGIILFWAVTLMWVFPLLAAELVMALSSERLRLVFRTLLILPLAFPIVVNVLIWEFLYDARDGVINTLLRGIGLDALAQDWVGDPDTALYALMVIGFPWVASLPFLIFLAALQNIPADVLQAAEIDGCGKLRRFWSIDLPLLAGQFRLLFVLAIISVLQYGMQAHLITRGGPDNATQVPVLRMLSVAFEQSDWGYAAALGTTLFCITLIASVSSMLLSRRSAAHGRS